MKGAEHVSVLMRRVRVSTLLTLIIVGAMLLTFGDLRSAGAIGTPPGSGISHDQTECADHGGFHALGTFGSATAHDIGVNFPGSNLRAGATSWMFPNASTGSTTGGNNNSLCGGGNVPSPFVGP